MRTNCCKENTEYMEHHHCQKYRSNRIFYPIISCIISLLVFMADFSTNLQEYALTCIKTATTPSLFDGNNSLPNTLTATIFQ